MFPVISQMIHQLNTSVRLVSLDELQKRNEMIRALSKNTKVVEAREKDAYRELNSTQQQLHELNQTQLNTSRHQQDLEAKSFPFVLI